MRKIRRLAQILARIGPAGRPRPTLRTAPTLLSLEGRALLSHAPRLAVWAEVGPLRVRSEHGHHALPSTHNPLNEVIVGGHVSKHPRFYSEYRGPQLASLNATGADGTLILGVGYRFTGRLAGPIDPSRQAYYVFGVDRGGAKAPSTVMPPMSKGASSAKPGVPTMSSGDEQSLVLFPRRPNIFVDALITLEVGPAGNSGQVTLMQPDGSPGPARPIAPADFRVSGNKITVLVSSDLLPPNGFPADRYFYAFWAATGLDSTNEVASFAPEYDITQIGLHRH